MSYKDPYDDPKAKERIKERLKNMIPKVVESDLKQHLYDPQKIFDALKKETGLEKEKAKKLVETVSRYLISNSIRIITTPMVREVVNSFCLKLKLEETRLKHTRVGLPKWDLDNIYRNNGKEDYIKKSIELIEELSIKIEKYVNPSIIIKEKIKIELKKIRELLGNYYESSDFLILTHIKNENDNIDKLIKLLEEGKKFENGK